MRARLRSDLLAPQLLIDNRTVPVVLAPGLTMAPLSFYHIHMIRTVVALLIAPLCMPLMVACHDLLWAFQHRDNPNIQYLTLFPLILLAIISYGSTLLVGIPMLVFLRWVGFSGWWVAGLIGFFIGAVLYLFLNVWYLMAHGGIDVPHLAPQIVILGISNFFSWPSAAMGAAVGVTFWLIARPDRSGHRVDHMAL